MNWARLMADGMIAIVPGVWKIFFKFSGGEEKWLKTSKP